ncbi:MAG TPA: CTP synthase [Candidatus Paceibacterota bacterium]|nr:CTP synthase [Candidatus Paceibacterota bacterium]
MRKKHHKYIFVIGGVMSGVGKGIATSSIGKILQSKGFKVNPIKIDPYLNVDAGTMNPTEHGEVFVLKSGLETDQDMGNYERFMGLSLREEDYMTSGMVYKTVIERERNLGYKGKFVEAIPHVTDEITRRIQKAADINGSSISLIEIGGTVGDYQNALFIEAARVLKLRNPDDVIFVLVSYLPIPNKVGEMKTRPTQHAVRLLNSYGIQPDFIVGRSEVPLDKKRKEKIAIWCNIPVDHIISAPDIESIYEVPLNFEKDNLGDTLLKALKVKKSGRKASDLLEWQKFVNKIKTVESEVKIAIVGKYFDTGDFVLSDAYLSVIEAIKFSSWHLGRRPVITWLNAKDFEKGKDLSALKEYDGVIVPGGFGETGIEGKINAIRYVRENKIPFFGLCYGMQLAVVETARNILGLKDAHTVEINPKTKHPVIDVMPDQKQKIADKNFGGTMRLGSYLAVLKKGTIAHEAYGKELVEERHRHRYEVNPAYIEKIASSGMVFSGVSPDGKLMEIAELPREIHPFFLGTQAHPELQAQPLNPHPLFTEFIKASIAHGKGRTGRQEKKKPLIVERIEEGVMEKA